MLSNEMIRFSVSLPKLYYRRLQIWARLKGTNRATLTSNTIQSRIEANWAQIEKDLEELARLENKTSQQLIDEWLGDEDT
jgi:hypothetical protein